MSDIEVGSSEPTTAEGAADTGIDVVDTPVESSSTEASQYEQEPAPEVPTYTVKVGDAEEQVTLDELQKSYMRQGDYTRKTQELAEQKQRLARAEAIAAALEVDPAATLAALSQAYGQSLTPQPADTQVEEDLDPTEQRLRSVEAQYEQWQEAQRQAQIESELTQLRSTYGDFDETALLTHAITKGIGDLGAAYRDMTYDAIRSQQEAKASEDARIVEQKRGATIVEGGSTTAAGTVASGPAKVGSVREAYLAAKQLLNR